MSWDIRIGDYRVKTLKGLKITTSVLNLADTATIEFPGQYMRNWVKVEDKIHVGDAVCIRLGYDDRLETEFTGYLKRISRDNNSLVLECEDALYLLDRSVEDKEYKTVSIRELLTEILHQVDPAFEVSCDFDFTYDKMVVFKSTALDVLKKVHEDTKANIWFEGKTLHVHRFLSKQFRRRFGRRNGQRHDGGCSCGRRHDHGKCGEGAAYRRSCELSELHGR